MNRTNLLAAFTAVCALTGCNDKTLSTALPAEEDETVAIRFNVPVTETKVTDNSLDDKVSTLQVFVFDKSGRIDASKWAENSKTLTINCTKGEKDIVALTNYTYQSSISNITDLDAKVLSLPENSNGFVMTGTESVNVTSSGNITIPVYRSVARIALTRITAKFTLQAYKNMDFRINRVFISNVPADRKMMQDDGPTRWYNKRGLNPTENIYIYDDVADVKVTESAPYLPQHYFYCFPNPTTVDSSDAQWCERKTRLVVETTLGDEKYYYPVTLPSVEANKQYSISMEITRPGSTDPDTPVQKADASVVIEVQPWEVGGVIHEQI